MRHCTACCHAGRLAAARALPSGAVFVCSSLKGSLNMLSYLPQATCFDGLPISCCGSRWRHKTCSPVGRPLAASRGDTCFVHRTWRLRCLPDSACALLSRAGSMCSASKAHQSRASSIAACRAGTVQGIIGRTGFSPTEAFRKYLWFALRERKFDQDAVDDLVQLKAALRLQDSEVGWMTPIWADVQAKPPGISVHMYNLHWDCAYTVAAYSRLL